MALNIEAATTAALAAALDGASRRHAAIATNIANAGTAGYVPARLSFDDYLAEARTALRDRGRLDASALERLRAMSQVEPEAADPSQKVQLDAEVSEMARNAVHFQALAQGVARHLSILGLAAADGRK